MAHLGAKNDVIKAQVRLALPNLISVVSAVEQSGRSPWLLVPVTGACPVDLIINKEGALHIHSTDNVLLLINIFPTMWESTVILPILSPSQHVVTQIKIS